MTLPPVIGFWTCGKLCRLAAFAPRKCPCTPLLNWSKHEVMRLSPADRAKLLDSLIASLDIVADAEAAWDELADRREDGLETGAAQAIPLDVAVARLEARFPG